MKARWWCVSITAFVAMVNTVSADKADAIASLGKRGVIIVRDKKQTGNPVVTVDFSARTADLIEGDLKVLKKFTKLEELNLNSTPLSDISLKEIVLELRELRTLDLTFTRVTSVGFSQLQKLRKLDFLSVGGPNVTDQAIKELKAVKTLTHFFLWKTKVTDDGMKELGHFQELRWLRLDRDLTDSGLNVIKGLKKLQLLLFQGSNNITDVQLSMLRKHELLHVFQGAFSEHEDRRQIAASEVTTMYLSTAQITDAGLKELKELKNLVTLWLDFTSVNCTGLRDLHELVHLKKLYLRESKTTDLGLKEIVFFKKLEILDLDDTEVTDLGLSELKVLKNLRSLNLRSTKIKGSCFKAFRELKNLQELNFSNTQVSDTELNDLREFNNLRKLSLRNTRVTEAGMKAIKKALPSCEIIY